MDVVVRVQALVDVLGCGSCAGRIMCFAVGSTGCGLFDTAADAGVATRSDLYHFVLRSETAALYCVADGFHPSCLFQLARWRSREG